MARRRSRQAQEATAEELAGLLRSLWRGVVRAARAQQHLAPLPQSQVVLLRRLFATGPATPAQLAEDLQLARPTISNLARELTEAGMIERSPSPTDKRSVYLVATETAHEVLDRFTTGRRSAVAEAMASLSDEDRETVIAALPALAHLSENLSTIAGDLPDWPQDDHIET